MAKKKFIVSATVLIEVRADSIEDAQEAIRRGAPLLGHLGVVGGESSTSNYCVGRTEPEEVEYLPFSDRNYR